MEARFYYVLFILITFFLLGFMDGTKSGEKNSKSFSETKVIYLDTIQEPKNDAFNMKKEEKLQKKDTAEYKPGYQKNKQWLYNGSFIPLR